MSGFDFEPLAELLLLGAALGGAPLWWWHRRQRGAPPAQRMRALTLLTLALTFELILVGAFTRLTDSGLGCPDWPGCYGSASPIGAHAEIQAAQTALPSGPVTHGKAWMEMLHRYLASGVGFLILVLAVQSWRVRGQPGGSVLPSPWWATASLVWVLVQGLFGALTVTMKLFPAIVTLHLLLALGLLMLLGWQAEGYAPQPLRVGRTGRGGRGLRVGVLLVLGLALGQVALGGWVSTNYAVLACSDFPTCQGQWWPPTDFAHGFTLWRELGQGHSGQTLPFAALTAIHLTHRLGAVVLTLALLALIWALHRVGPPAASWAYRLLAVLAWQLASGLSNVVLGWPLLAALAHTGGAAALLLILTLLLARLRAAAHPVS